MLRIIDLILDMFQLGNVELHVIGQAWLGCSSSLCGPQRPRPPARTLPQLLHCLYVSALTDFCLSGLGAVLEYSPVLCGPLRYLPQHDLRLCVSGKAISNKAFVIHFCAHTGFINMVWSDIHPRRTLLPTQRSSWRRSGGC